MVHIRGSNRASRAPVACFAGPRHDLGITLAELFGRLDLGESMATDLSIDHMVLPGLYSFPELGRDRAWEVWLVPLVGADVQKVHRFIATREDLDRMIEGSMELGSSLSD